METKETETSMALLTALLNLHISTEKEREGIQCLIEDLRGISIEYGRKITQLELLAQAIWPELKLPDTTILPAWMGITKTKDKTEEFLALLTRDMTPKNKQQTCTEEDI